MIPKSIQIQRKNMEIFPYKMDLENLTELEEYFTENMDTIVFPVLAEHYLLQEEFKRAHKVCEIGFSHHPNLPVGLFIDARIYMAEKKFIEAEKLLNIILTIDNGFYNAMVVLGEVQIKLKRADSTIRKTYKKIMEMDSSNERANAWLSGKPKPKREISKTKKTTEKSKPATSKAIKPKNASKKSASKPAKKKKHVKPKEKPNEFDNLRISPKVATFTLVGVLRGQKLYERALQVLTVMEEKKGVDKKRILKEKETLFGLLKYKESK